MKPHWIILLALALAVSARSGARAAKGSESQPGVAFFETHVRPLLVDRCYACHSAKASKVKGGLRLDSRAGLLRGGDSGKPSIVAGAPDASPLIAAVRWADPDLEMPPKHRLTDAETADLVQWVRMGAPDPRVETPAPGGANTGRSVEALKSEAATMWALRPPREPEPPKVKRPGWAVSPIDRFVQARLERKGLEPIGPASRRVLIRRATYDLTGLPPAPAEIDAFLADAAPGAFARVVDRLLASPAYGECWGRHWLDLARYADTSGDDADFPLPLAYRYRDWVVSAFNRDLPYDQFLRMQIAGDLLPADSDAERAEGLIATGFIALSRRFSVHPESEMQLTIDDTIDTMGKSVLGLTIGCARCHDHKFDPITQADYYALYGIFASSRYPQGGSEEAQFPQFMTPLSPADEQSPAFVAYSHQIDALDSEVEARRDEWIKKGTGDQPSLHRVLEARAKRLQFARANLPTAPAAYAMADGVGRDYPILLRGDEKRPGAIVRRGFPALLGGQTIEAGEAGSGRRELAEWIVDPYNPLTARVMANRIWQYHFGRGIVPTPSDFGTRGVPPTDPDLLDWLSVQFVRGGWSIKAMHRLIMLSSTYQLASDLDPADDAPATIADGARLDQTADPGDEAGWRFARRRLDAEAIRDSMLQLAGTLDTSPPRPQPFPPIASWSFTQHNPFTADYPSRRRTLYLMQQRIRREPYLALFDGPDPNAATPVRGASATPLQALYLMNDPFVRDQTLAMASKLLAGPGDDTARLRAAWVEILGRPASDAEIAAASDYLRAYEQGLAAARVAPDQRHRTALASLLRALFASNEFMFVQ